EQAPLAGLQVPASWHWSGAVQRTGFAPLHAPAWQVSLRVHALPSSHVLPSGLAGLEQAPVAGLQVPASWHWSGAVQRTGAPALQVPPAQVSPVVHTLPSSQVVPSGLAGLEQTPVAGLHLPASWHWSGGAHRTGVPGAHVPLSQASPVVHASPSSHEVPFGLGGFEHLPVAGSQVPASWHWSCAVQTTGFAPVQVPAWQVSLRVHALSSSQPAVFGAWTQPVTAVQESSVHGLPSSQLRAAPVQTPSEHMSPVVQAFPSSQGAVFGVLTQPVAGSQESSVHGLPSSQLSGAPAQTPSEHMSPVVQAFPSSHMVPEGKAVPATQVPDDRSQLSTPVQASPSSHSASLLQP